MKRCLIICLITFFLFFSSSCSKPHFLDISLFCEKLNEEIPKLEISEKDTFIEESEKEIDYYLFSSLQTKNNFLIKLTAEKDSYRIKRCSITLLSNNQKTESGMCDDFKNICKHIINVMTIQRENSDEIIKNLNIPQGKNFTYANPCYSETEHFKYLYCANKLGANLTIENKLLMSYDETHPTLRNDKSRPTF